MLPGECTFAIKVKCEDCGETMHLQVLRSPAGFYLGHTCSICGPWDRCTEYFATREQAEKELQFIKKHGFAASAYVRR